MSDVKRELFGSVREHSPQMEPRKEYWQKPGVHSWLERFSSDELGEAVVAGLAVTSHEQLRARALRIMGLEVAASRDQQMTALRPYIERYQQRVEGFRVYQPTLGHKIATWLERDQLVPQQNIRDIPVFVTDPVLRYADREGFPGSHDAVFDTDMNVITVQADNPLFILDHESCHAMSCIVGTGVTGFVKREPFVKGQVRGGSGNEWLNEGVTIMGEMMTSPESSRRIMYAKGEQDMYLEGFYFLSKLFQREVGFGDVDLFRAYFHQGTWRVDLETATRRRFGCTVSDLNGLFFGFSPDSQQTMQDILEGKKPVKLRVNAREEGRRRKLEALQQIFPLIEIEVRTK